MGRAKTHSPPSWIVGLPLLLSLEVVPQDSLELSSRGLDEDTDYDQNNERLISPLLSG